MIAPLRLSQPETGSASSGPRRIGSLLPAVFARYGIVLAQPLPQETPVCVKSARISNAVQPQKTPSRRRQAVQLPLFVPAELQTIDTVMVR